MPANDSVVVDILDEKLAFAKQFAATSTFKPSPPKEGEEKMAASERNAADLIASLPEEDNDVARAGGFDLVMECTGAPPCIQLGMFAARARARFVQVGMGANDVTIPIHKIGIKELEMTGVSVAIRVHMGGRITDTCSDSPSATASARTRRRSTSSHRASSTLPRSSRTATPLTSASRHSTRQPRARARMARA